MKWDNLTPRYVPCGLVAISEGHEAHTWTLLEKDADGGPDTGYLFKCLGLKTAKVILFKSSGKYYTEEWWVIPDGAIAPCDMEKSPDFHRINNGPVLVESQEPWGYPALLVAQHD